MKGRRPRGRSRIGIIDDLKEGSYVRIKRRAEDSGVEMLDAGDLPEGRELMMSTVYIGCGGEDNF